MKHHPGHLRTSGISLIEALVGLVLLSAGMLAVMTLLTQGIALMRADLEARREARAAADATELSAMQPHINADLYDQINTELQQRRTENQPAVYAE